MLVLTTKNIEVEEQIQVKDENEKILVDYTMQITPKEMQQIKNIIFDESYALGKIKDTDVILEKSNKLEEKFERIVFKDKLEEIKEKCGQYKYDELVEMIYNFFMNIFIEKKAAQISTITTKLQKITKN